MYMHFIIRAGLLDLLIWLHSECFILLLSARCSHTEAAAAFLSLQRWTEHMQRHQQDQSTLQWEGGKYTQMYSLSLHFMLQLIDNMYN